MDDINNMIKRKNELIKKIEQQKRIMELIKNPHIKNSLEPIIQMKKHKAAINIQVYLAN
jgi:hypothetical protein